VAPAIRATALAMILDGDRLLVSQGFDNAKRERFYRLLGGGIEFGETGADAVAREVDQSSAHGLDACPSVSHRRRKALPRRHRGSSRG
jgi:hypothetical protein